MTGPKMYTTPEVRRILGIQSRQTLYNWGAVPDELGPGRRGVGLWSRETIERLAVEHDRKPNWNAP